MSAEKPYGVVNFSDPSNPQASASCANEVPMTWLTLRGNDYFCWWPKNRRQITKLVRNPELEKPNKDNWYQIKVELESTHGM